MVSVKHLKLNLLKLALDLPPEKYSNWNFWLARYLKALKKSLTWTIVNKQSRFSDENSICRRQRKLGFGTFCNSSNTNRQTKTLKNTF
jgi:hypothetical protein